MALTSPPLSPPQVSQEGLPAIERLAIDSRLALENTDEALDMLEAVTSIVNPLVEQIPQILTTQAEMLGLIKELQHQLLKSQAAQELREEYRHRRSRRTHDESEEGRGQQPESPRKSRKQRLLMLTT